jgi:hypothetical protein
MVEKSRTLKFRKKGGKRNNKSKKYRQRGGAARIRNVHLGCMDWFNNGQQPKPDAFRKNNNDPKSGRFPTDNDSLDNDIFLYAPKAEQVKAVAFEDRSLGHHQNFFYKLFDTLYEWKRQDGSEEFVEVEELKILDKDTLKNGLRLIWDKKHTGGMMATTLATVGAATDGLKSNEINTVNDPIYVLAHQIIFTGKEQVEPAAFYQEESANAEEFRAMMRQAPREKQKVLAARAATLVAEGADPTVKFIELLEKYAIKVYEKTRDAAPSLINDIIINNIKSDELQLIILAYGVVVNKHILRPTNRNLLELVKKGNKISLGSRFKTIDDYRFKEDIYNIFNKNDKLLLSLITTDPKDTSAPINLVNKLDPPTAARAAVQSGADQSAVEEAVEKVTEGGTGVDEEIDISTPNWAWYSSGMRGLITPKGLLQLTVTPEPPEPPGPPAPGLPPPGPPAPGSPPPGPATVFYLDPALATQTISNIFTDNDDSNFRAFTFSSDDESRAGDTLTVSYFGGGVISFNQILNIFLIQLYYQLVSLYNENIPLLENTTLPQMILINTMQKPKLETMQATAKMSSSTMLSGRDPKELPLHESVKYYDAAVWETAVKNLAMKEKEKLWNAITKKKEPSKLDKNRLAMAAANIGYITQIKNAMGKDSNISKDDAKNMVAEENKINEMKKLRFIQAMAHRYNRSKVKTISQRVETVVDATISAAEAAATAFDEGANAMFDITPGELDEGEVENQRRFWDARRAGPHYREQLLEENESASGDDGGGRVQNGGLKFKIESTEESSNDSNRWGKLDGKIEQESTWQNAIKLGIIGGQAGFKEKKEKQTKDLISFIKYAEHGQKSIMKLGKKEVMEETDMCSFETADFEGKKKSIGIYSYNYCYDDWLNFETFYLIFKKKYDVQFAKLYEIKSFKELNDEIQTLANELFKEAAKYGKHIQYLFLKTADSNDSRNIAMRMFGGAIKYAIEWNDRTQTTRKTKFASSDDISHPISSYLDLSNSNKDTENSIFNSVLGSILRYYTSHDDELKRKSSKTSIDFIRGKNPFKDEIRKLKGIDFIKKLTSEGEPSEINREIKSTLNINLTGAISRERDISDIDTTGTPLKPNAYIAKYIATTLLNFYETKKSTAPTPPKRSMFSLRFNTNDQKTPDLPKWQEHVNRKGFEIAAKRLNLETYDNKLKLLAVIYYNAIAKKPKKLEVTSKNIKTFEEQIKSSIREVDSDLFKEYQEGARGKKLQILISAFQEPDFENLLEAYGINNTQSESTYRAAAAVVATAESAATKLQNKQRQRKAKQEVVAKREENEQNQAATLLQGKMRQRAAAAEVAARRAEMAGAEQQEMAGAEREQRAAEAAEQQEMAGAERESKLVAAAAEQAASARAAAAAAPGATGAK